MTNPPTIPDKSKELSMASEQAPEVTYENYLERFIAMGAAVKRAADAVRKMSREARLIEALDECADKLWIARCDSKDPAFREAAETACNMARAAKEAL
jgi:hypothetical protein